MSALFIFKKQHPKPGVRFLSAAEQTMRAWARRIHLQEELPEIYRDFFKTLPQGTEFPYTVLTPAYEGFLSKANPKLVCQLDQHLYVVEQRRKELAVTCFSNADINYIEIGTILLKSWITLSGVTPEGLASTTLKASAVTLPLFNPIVEKIRAISAGPTADLAAERAKFNDLMNVHFKFMNYARRSLLPGEQVITSLLQPEIQTPVVKMFNQTFYKTLSPAHLTILTDHELIVISEDNERWVKGARYGGIWWYIPLHKITAVDLAEQTDNTLALSIHFPANDQITYLFTASNRPQVEALLTRLKPLTPALA
jgi:hypothetical protein